MNRETLDLSRMTVEDLFRAKQERRKRLARLPFEEKIAIVERLQTVSKALKGEKPIFAEFLRACPDFAGEPIAEWDVVEEWYAKRNLTAPDHPFDKRPDVIARTVSGKKIGVELKSWVNRDQIAEARKQENIQDNLLKAIGKQPPNNTQHIGYVWLSEKNVRFDTRDAADFRQQIFALIKEVDQNWSQTPDHEQNLWKDRSDLADFPILQKYLNRVRYHSKTRPHSHNWIKFRFPSPSSLKSHFSPKTMRDTLERALLEHRDDNRYKDLKKHVGLDEVYLLVHYNFKAFAYNPPFKSPDFGFKEAAEFASSVLNGDGGHFDRIFLFHFLIGKEEAFNIL